MRYIELQDGILIDINSIEGIKKLDNNTCEVYTHQRKYLSTTYSYETLVAILKEGEVGEVVNREISREEKFKNTMEKLDAVLNKSQHFAG